MTYKIVTGAPLYSGRVPRGYSIILEPGQVKSVLRRLGYNWEPRCKLLVRYHHNFVIESALAYFGNAKTKASETTIYHLKG